MLNKRGQQFIEYLLLIAAVAIVCIIFLKPQQGNVMYDAVNASLSSIVSDINHQPLANSPSAPPPPPLAIPPTRAPTCTPNCSCAASLCFNQNCSDGCGSTCTGQLQRVDGTCTCPDDATCNTEPAPICTGQCGGTGDPNTTTLTCMGTSCKDGKVCCAGGCQAAGTTCS